MPIRPLLLCFPSLYEANTWSHSVTLKKAPSLFFTESSFGQFVIVLGETTVLCVLHHGQVVDSHHRGAAHRTELFHALVHAAELRPGQPEAIFRRGI